MQQKNLFNETVTIRQRPRKKAKGAVTFKKYNQKQMMLLPPDLEELIPAKHLVRVVDATIEGLNIEPLLATYQGGGASAYHPKMLLKVLIYAYISKIYTSRGIAKVLQQDIHFMWLAATNRPDFRTINGFRSGRLKEVIDQIFADTVIYLLNHGYIDLKEYFVDGTKLPADNNKHKVVWAKNTKRYKEMVQRKIQERLREIQRLNDEENQRYGDRDLEEMGEDITITSQDLQEHIQRLNEKIKSAPQSKRTLTIVKELQKDCLPKLQRYEQQEQLLAGRNSYGKTDPDATCFFTKDGQLLPAYNLIMGTQNQFIVNYNFHQQKASESDGFIAHMDRLNNLLDRLPQSAMADSAYGSEENYAYLQKNNIQNYLKYNLFHLEKTKKYRRNLYRKDNFVYEQQSNTYSCPQGRTLTYKENRQVITKNGYRTSIQIFQGIACADCPAAMECKRGAGPRTIQINAVLDGYRAQARENLNSERGIKLRQRRSSDVEPPFADIKFNQGYHRFRLRGKEKVNIEFGLLSIAHNTKKLAIMNH